MNIKATTIIGLLALSATACAGGESNSSPRKEEQAVAAAQLDQFLVNQPIPSFNWSQLRQNLIEIEMAQASTTATTSFFFNFGSAEPITVCPSVGFPIPATYQLTNPDQTVSIDTPGDGGAAVTVGQLEATGVYTADTSGTYVICINGEGDAYPIYHEGFVTAVAGPAQWVDGAIALTGKPSVDFSVGED